MFLLLLEDDRPVGGGGGSGFIFFLASAVKLGRALWFTQHVNSLCRLQF